MQRTLLVGFDAACWEYLQPMLDAGRLPHLQKLMDSGSAGVLHSTMPPWTPTAWSSIVTGKNAGKHGIFDMMRHRPDDYDFTPINGQMRQGTPFWKYLNDAGVRVGLVNVPFSYPPAPLDGFMLCGFGTPDSVRDLAWPAEVLPWVEERLGPYEPVVSTALLRSGRAEEILAAEKHHQHYLVEAAVALAEKYDVQVLVINLMLTDHANHKMPTMELVQQAYEQSDADLGRLIEGFRPENIMLLSDHGSSRLKGDFLLNMWLRDHGYAVYKPHGPQQQAAALNWILTEWLQAHKGYSGMPLKVMRRLMKLALLRLPRGMQRRFWQQVEQVMPFAETHMRQSTRPDFQRTKLFPGSLYSGLLYFNVTGREPHGVVPPSERQALAAKLKEELSQVREPDTGKPLFSNIYLSDELYHGSLAKYAPDVVVDAYWSQWNIRTRHPAAHRGKQHDRYFVTYEDHRDFGWHSPDGVWVFAGPALPAGRTAKNGNPNLLDIPATLLHLYDVPLPEDWDGRVLLELLSGALRDRPVRTQAGDVEEPAGAEHVYSAEEADAMMSHLAALGYLD